MANRQVIRQAAESLRSGGVIAYPTEAVFGLGCDPENLAAVSRLLEIKRRNPRHGLIIVAAEYAQLRAFMAPLPETARKRLRDSWPGPHTWLVPASHTCPAWICGEHTTVAVRVSAHPIVRALCLQADMAIVSTSANRRGRPPARTTLACRARFGSDVDVLVSGRTGDQARPTAIMDALSGELVRSA